MPVSVKVTKRTGTMDKNELVSFRVIVAAEYSGNTPDVGPSHGGVTQVFQGYDAASELEDEEFFVSHRDEDSPPTLQGKGFFVYLSLHRESCQKRKDVVQCSCYYLLRAWIGLARLRL